MIVHGDHGSRIIDFDPVTRNAARIDDHALLAGFSTLFAVRTPGVAARYEEEPAAAGTLLRAALQPGATPARTGATPSVFLNDPDNIPRLRRPMPQSWRATSRDE